MRLWLVLLCDKIARKQHRTSAFLALLLRMMTELYSHHPLATKINKLHIKVTVLQALKLH